MKRTILALIATLSLWLAKPLQVNANDICYTATITLAYSAVVQTVSIVPADFSVSPTQFGPVFFSGGPYPANTTFTIVAEARWDREITGIQVEARDANGNLLGGQNTVFGGKFVLGCNNSTDSNGSSSPPDNSPQIVLGQPNILMPTGVVGGVASVTLPFQGAPGTPNQGALEVWIIEGQKAINIPAGALNELEPGTSVYPGLSADSLATLDITLYRDAPFSLIYDGDGTCVFATFTNTGENVRYEIIC